MSKKSVIQRALKRDRLVKKYAAKRSELKAILADPKTSEEAFYAAQRKLSKLPRGSSSVRQKNRCSISGRPRAYMRKFAMCRLCFRKRALEGDITGVTKSSW